MTQDAAQTRREAGLSVAGWPLSRKMALALAIPLLLAAVLGGLRVSGDYGDYASSNFADFVSLRSATWAITPHTVSTSAR